MKIINENYKLKEDELNFLKNRLNFTDGNSEILFFQEINKIRDMLKEKTNELIKQDYFHNQAQNDNKDKFNQIKDNNLMLCDENDKLKEIIKDILCFHSNGQSKELENLLIYLQTNTDFINQNNNEIKENFINEDSDSKKLDESVNNNINNNQEKNHAEFAEKVLSEFDKIFQDQLKRVEKFFKKDNLNTSNMDNAKRKISFKRRNSAEKNYFEWKSKSPYELWADTLRNKNITKSPSHNNIVNSQSAIDLDNMIVQSKNKIRDSMKTYNNLNINILNPKESKKNFDFFQNEENKKINSKNNNKSLSPHEVRINDKFKISQSSPMNNINEVNSARNKNKNEFKTRE